VMGTQQWEGGMRHARLAGICMSSCLASSLRKTNGKLSLVEGVMKAEYVWFV